jgi:hypothetical protein
MRKLTALFILSLLAALSTFSQTTHIFPATDTNNSFTGNNNFLGTLNYYSDTGSANAYVITPTPTLSSLLPGFSACFAAAHANTGTSTLQVNSIAGITLKKGPYPANLISGDIVAGQIVCATYDGTYFQVQGQLGNAASSLLGLNNTWTGTNNFSNTITLPVTGNAALKPASSSVIEYAAPTGSDSNDGLSWGTAKLTIRGACIALPGGSSGPDTCGTGTIYFADGTSANTTSTGCGLWFMNYQDPNFSSPPACWIRQSGAVSIIGVGGTTHGANPHAGPQALLVAGSNIDRNHPGIWISGGGTLYFQNIDIQYPGRGVVIGECSNNTRTDTCNTSGNNFNNVSANLNQAVGYGPGFDITGGSFWIWLRDVSSDGTDHTNSPTSDEAAAILIDGRTNTGTGLVFVADCNTSDGGVKFYTGSNGGSFYVNDFTTEALQGEPSVWFATQSGQLADDYALGSVWNVTTADAANPSPGFENDTLNNTIVVSSIFGQTENIVGPAIVLNQYGNNLLHQTTSPILNKQIGFFGNQVAGQSEVQGRGFEPTAVRFVNIASQNASTWPTSFSGGTTVITTGQPAPDGTNGAASVAYGTFIESTVAATAPYYSGGAVPIVVGDAYVFAVWVRSINGNGYSGDEPVTFTLNAQGFGVGDTCALTGPTTASPAIGAAPYFQGDGEWERVWGVCIVSANPSDAGISLNIIVDTDHPLDVYAPMVLHIPAGTLSNNEVYALGESLGSYSPSCVVGTNCGMTISSPINLGALDQAGISTANSGVPQNIIASTTAAGYYHVSYYVDVNAECATPGPASLTVSTSWTDATTGRTSSNQVLEPSNSTPTLNQFVSQDVEVWVAANTPITFTGTYNACTTGTWTYDVHASALRVR